MLIEDPEVSWSRIGRVIERHRSTVMREVTARGGRSGYRPASADRAAQTARLRPRARLLVVDGGLRKRVIRELDEGRSPFSIWADLVAEDFDGRVCVETIYQAIFTGILGLKASECLRTRRPRRRHRQTRRPNRSAGLPNIGLRPDTVNDREEPGHWEADQIIGANNCSSLLTLTERVTRYAIGITMPEGYDAISTLAGLCEALDSIPANLLKSVTFDQGSEWAEWETLAVTYNINCWFCEPHSPWQRGQIENQNRAWRFWFPRGIRLDILDQTHVDHVAAIINGQRRRNLDCQRPADLYHAATVQ